MSSETVAVPSMPTVPCKRDWKKTAIGLLVMFAIGLFVGFGLNGSEYEDRFLASTLLSMYESFEIAYRDVLALRLLTYKFAVNGMCWESVYVPVWLLNDAEERINFCYEMLATLKAGGWLDEYHDELKQLLVLLDELKKGIRESQYIVTKQCPSRDDANKIAVLHEKFQKYGKEISSIINNMILRLVGEKLAIAHTLGS